MKNIILLILIFISNNIKSQDLYPKEDLTLKTLFTSLDEKHPEMIKFINDNEAKYVLDFNSDFAIRYPDTIKNPNKIRFISVSFRNNEDLEKQIDALSQFPNLEYLEVKTAVQFRKSDIKKNLSLPRNLQDLHNLKYLQISGSYNIDYSLFFETLGSIPKLEYLGLPHVLEEEQIPNSFLKLSQLKGLKLESFKAFYLPSDLSSMKNLESIIIVPEQYKNMGSELQKLSTLQNLKELTFYYGKFSIENLIYFKEFKELNSLSLTNVEFDDVQNLIDNLPKNNNIETLILLNLKSNGNSIDFSNLKNLKTLNIGSYSKYKISLNESLYDLQNLQSLSIQTDSLVSLSSNLGKLKNLERLNLSYNEIAFLPESIGELNKLVYLDLRQNNMASLPNSISNLNKLEVLESSNNGIAKLPNDFGKLASLTSLNLENNRIEELPSTFVQFSKLEYLNLGNNYLKTLPDEFGSLKSVLRLNLDSNFLKKLPVSISELDKLRYLMLGNNNLQELPDDFGNLKALEEIYLGGNRYNSNSTNNRYYSGNNDHPRPDPVFNEIRILPQSFSKLKNLKRIYLREMSTLDGASLFKILFKTASKNYTLDISNTKISYLPKTGWQNFLASSLNMGGNVITQIPADILNAPNLLEFRFKLNEKDGLSYNLNGKAELNAFFEEKGFVDFASLPKTQEMAKAYLDNAYNRKYTKGDNILELMNKAFLLDSAYTEDNIRSSDYADALLNNKDFEKAIKYYNRAIARDTARGPYILNFIIPNFQNRAKAHLAVGDTLLAMEGLAYASERFSSSDWAEAGILAKAIGKDTLASQYFKNGEKFYKGYINRNLEQNQINYGYQLSLLELYILEENLLQASDYLSFLENEIIKPKDKQLLLEYLKHIIFILQGDINENDLKLFENKIANSEITISSWSFDLVNFWLEMTDVKQLKKERIKSLTKAMENNK